MALYYKDEGDLHVVWSYMTKDFMHKSVLIINPSLLLCHNWLAWAISLDRKLLNYLPACFLFSSKANMERQKSGC